MTEEKRSKKKVAAPRGSRIEQENGVFLQDRTDDSDVLKADDDRAKDAGLLMKDRKDEGSLVSKEDQKVKLQKETRDLERQQRKKEVAKKREKRKEQRDQVKDKKMQREREHLLGKDGKVPVDEEDITERSSVTEKRLLEEDGERQTLSMGRRRKGQEDDVLVMGRPHKIAFTAGFETQGILDTGCTRSVAGQDWTEGYIRVLDKEDQREVVKRSNDV